MGAGRGLRAGHGPFKMTFLENKYRPELRGCHNNNVKLAGCLFLRGRAAGRSVAGRAYSSRHAAGPDVPVLARPGPAALWVPVSAVPAAMAGVPRPVYVYSPEYVALCDSLCKVPKRVSAGAGRGGAGSRAVRPGRGGSRRPARPQERGKLRGAGGPGGSSVGSERGGPVCAFTSPLAGLGH